MITLSNPLPHHIERSAFNVVSCAAKTLGYYVSLHKGKAYLANAISAFRVGARIFFGILDGLMGIGLIIAFVPVVSVTLFFLLLMLAYINMFLWGNHTSIRKWIEPMSRQDAIEHHLKIERVLRQLNQLKHSRLLSKTPIIGYLFRRLVRKTILIEESLFEKAYPNFSKIAGDIPVHSFDPSDPWQSEEESDLYSDYYLRK